MSKRVFAPPKRSTNSRIPDPVSRRSEQNVKQKQQQQKNVAATSSTVQPLTSTVLPLATSTVQTSISSTSSNSTSSAVLPLATSAIQPSTSTSSNSTSSTVLPLAVETSTANTETENTENLQCPLSSYSSVKFSQICTTIASQSNCDLTNRPLKFKILTLNRQLVVFPVSLTFIIKGVMKFVGSINYRAIMELQFDDSETTYEYEKMESIECGQCKVAEQPNCSKCAGCKHPQPCKRNFIRKRRKFGNLHSQITLYHESISAPDFLISTKHRCDSTYMLNRTDQNVSTALLKLANILLNVRVSPECNNTPQYSDWTQWTEFEIVDTHKCQNICKCTSATQLPKMTAEQTLINDSNFSCSERLNILESVISLTSSLTILEHPNDYSINWQLQIGPLI